MQVAFSGSIPHYYEQYLGGFLFEPYALDIVQRCGSLKSDYLLELACGTGRVTAHLFSKALNYTATDINEDMLAVAKQKVTDERIIWQVADAQVLPFTNDSFDMVVCQFGVMFFKDKQKAFREVYRVLKPDGTFIFNTWDSLEQNPVNGLIQKVLADLLQAEAPEFLTKGPFSFYNEPEISTLLGSSGFTTVTIEKVAKTGVAESTDDVINGFTKGTPLAYFFNEQEPQLQKEFSERFRKELVQQYGERNLHIPMQALVCTAGK